MVFIVDFQYIWITDKLLEHSAESDILGTRLIGFYCVTTRHAVMQCFYVGLFATPLTTYLVLGFDFFINVYLSVKIIWVRKKNPENVVKQVSLLQELAINESIEFITPLSFFVTFLFVYYGPNAKLFGNIGRSYWSYKAVDNIGHMVKMILMFLVIDFGSTILNSFLLWFCCNINLFLAIAALQKEFGFAFSVIASMFTSLVSISFLE